MDKFKHYEILSADIIHQIQFMNDVYNFDINHMIATLMEMRNIQKEVLNEQKRSFVDNIIKQKTQNENFKTICGLSESDAVKLCEDAGYIVRITRKDDYNFIVTMDLRFDRINLEIDDNIVTHFDFG